MIENIDKVERKAIKASTTPQAAHLLEAVHRAARQWQAGASTQGQIEVIDDQLVRVVDQSVLATMGLPAGRDEVSVGGSIDWTLGDQRGTAPRVGQLYAITYLYHPRYEVVTFNHAIRDDKSKQKSPDLRIERLPLEIMCKLDWDTTKPGEGFGG